MDCWTFRSYGAQITNSHCIRTGYWPIIPGKLYSQYLIWWTIPFGILQQYISLVQKLNILKRFNSVLQADRTWHNWSNEIKVFARNYHSLLQQVVDRHCGWMDDYRLQHFVLNSEYILQIAKQGIHKQQLRPWCWHLVNSTKRSMSSLILTH